MKSQLWPDWNGRAAVSTQAPSNRECPFYGIAIGPNSDEGLVDLGDVILQAGRVHRAREGTYQVKKVRGVVADFNAIANLQVLLFESESEANAYAGTSRPNKDYSGAFSSAATLPAFGSPQLAIPFTGRRSARVALTATGLGTNSFSYEVLGVRWSEQAAAVQRVPLTLQTSVDTDPTLNTYAFYIGGTDNGEAWDLLELYVASSVNATWTGEATTLGEQR